MKTFGASLLFLVLLWGPFPQRAQAFVVIPEPPSGRFTMNLDLPTTTFTTIGYGVQSWNSLAEKALATWNQVGIGTGLDFNFFGVRVPTVTGNPCARDGVNEVRWASNVCGMSFGTAVAITTWRIVGGQRVEADVVFNDNLSWNAYPGPLVPAAGGGTLNDFFRVAVHEFGHAAGLDHPDQFGQTVTAIMNAPESNVDNLQTDDINGAHAIQWTPPQFALSVMISGSGTVAGSPAGLTCSTGTCTVNIASGTAETLTATAARGFTFAGWSGGGCSGTGSCTVTLTTMTTVTATFNTLPTPLYRFFNLVTGTHFYTINEGEKNNVMATLPQYRFEGIAYYAHPGSISGIPPVYRFYNVLTGTHFYTINEGEKNNVMATLPQYRFEGAAYFADATR